MAFFVRSTEQIPCPGCGCKLSVIGSRRRVWYQRSGDRSVLIIRRLHCEMCAKIHHELPDLLVPYKRYDAESIESTVEDPSHSDVAADESTIIRWKAWFSVWGPYAVKCLESISIQYNLPVNPSSLSTGSVLQQLGRFVGSASKWLCRVVRPIGNSQLWVTDPFCIPVLCQSE